MSSSLEVSKESTIDRVRKVVASNLGCPIEEVNDTLTFEEVGFDSVDRMQFLFELEKEFDVGIDAEDLSLCKNVKEVAALMSND